MKLSKDPCHPKSQYGQSVVDSRFSQYDLLGHMPLCQVQVVGCSVVTDSHVQPCSGLSHLLFEY